jgi:intracellular septation protein A
VSRWTWARRNAPGAAVEILVNFALPFLIFVVARPSLGDVHALMAASAPPIAWTILEFARKRRIDALSLLVLLGIVLSFLAFLGGGGARFLQLRERLVTVAIGLVFLGSAAIGRPLIYQLARATMRRKSPAEAESFEALRESVVFRRAMMVMTLVWGTALVVESAISCVLVFTLTVPQYLLVSPIVGYAALGALTAWTFSYAKRRIRAARQAVASERPPTPWSGRRSPTASGR